MFLRQQIVCQRRGIPRLSLWSNLGAEAIFDSDVLREHNFEKGHTLAVLIHESDGLLRGTSASSSLNWN
jgi:hypothetical protein